LLKQQQQQLCCVSGPGHSLWLLSTYIQGETQFPGFSYTTTLDDITVGYYKSGTYFPRGNTTNEDDVVNSDYIKAISDYMYKSFLRRAELLSQDSQNDSKYFYTNTHNDVMQSFVFLKSNYTYNL